MTIGKNTKLASTGSDISANVIIGAYCSIGPYVQMHSRTQHSCIQDPKIVTTAQLDGYHSYSDEKITIGNDVWIGRNAVLLGGITIGDGAIIGAYSVVSKNVSPYMIVAGNPVRVIRSRFRPDQIEALMRIKWWEWDSVDARELRDVDTFIEKYSH